jgi:hypothetical protein
MGYTFLRHHCKREAPMSEATVTALRVKDPTGPIRSRRARQKRKGQIMAAAENPNEIKPSDTVETSLRERLALVSAASIGGVAIAATALSLTDLADTIQDAAHIAEWKAGALALTLDANFIATEAFSLFATAPVAEATHRATTATKVITLTMSGIANAYAMAHGADGPIMQGACIAAGFAIPTLIALATYTLGKAVRN